MLSRKHFHILFFCFFFVTAIHAQDKNKAIALKTILESIEKQHHVSINYLENDITGIRIVPPKKSLSLDMKINYLQKKTNLQFDKLDKLFYTISSKKETAIICGTIYNKSDNSPIAGVNIQSSIGTHAVTNNNGYFEINGETSTFITISYIGYTTQKIALQEQTNAKKSNKDCFKINLEVEILNLESVIANHYLASGISKTNDGKFEIKPKKLGILPGLIEPDVLQTMLQIPGVYSTDESLASINVRGGTNDQNLFLWNGIKMYQTGHFFGLISAFNPYLPHTISISKNGSSPFYGESVSSVVDISSDQQQLKKPSFSAGINMINADVYFKFNLNKKGFIEMASRRSITDLAHTPTYDSYYNKAFQNTTITNYTTKQNVDFNSEEKFKFYDISLKYLQNIGEKDQLNIDLITINDQLNVFQKSTTDNVYQSENNLLIQKNHGANLSWTRNWSPKNSTKINAFISSYELDAETSKIQSSQTVKQENLMLDDGLKIENNHQISSKFSINEGYQFEEMGATNLDAVNNPLYYRKRKQVLRTHAVIAEGKYNDPIKKITLNTGIRANYIEEFKKTLIEPRLQFNYEMAPNLNLEVLGEFKSQNTFQVIDLQQDYFGIEKRRWILSNNNSIPIQKSKQASIGLSFAKNNWLLSLDNFYKTVNGINSSSQGFQNQLELVKINGDYIVWGGEMLIQKKINHFTTWLSYTYNENNYHFLDINQNEFPNNFELSHFVSWAGTYEIKKLKIALGSKWHSGKPETTPLTNVIDNSNTSNPKINYNFPNNKNLNDFFQINFSATYKWETFNETIYNLGFSVINVTNRKNEINEFYRINSTTNTIEDVKNYSLDRTFNVSFRVSF
ncbi:carboxypeptidase-like regulatory domain-containing protein [Flavobacterium sp. IMCC34518]|uniref:TonB-dependent receptor n=1 Tax=Flavobacterium sp. IMCC34518 TaxID=3003623 RepID=UPI00248284CC|nr:carboxypeptidase-like regulatory domain-containing protein [Flavobacterium sp. IMCC34518]